MARVRAHRTVATTAALAVVLLTASCSQHAHRNPVASGTSPSSPSTPIGFATTPSYVGPSAVGLAARGGATRVGTALFALAAAETGVTGSPFRSVAADLQSALNSARAAVSAEATATQHNPPNCTQVRQATGTVTTDLNRAVGAVSTVHTLADGVSSDVARLNTAVAVVQHALTGAVDAATRANAARALDQARTLATSASSGAQNMVSHAAAVEHTLAGLVARARALAAKHCS
jgi:hypothetical protein